MVTDEYKKAYLLLSGAIVFVFVILAYDVFQKTSVSVSPPPVSTPPTIQTTDTSTPSLGLVTAKREKDIGNVTGTVEYLPLRSTGDTSVFLISLDTHSVNLDIFDFTHDIQRITNGQTIQPLATNPKGSGHHRQAEVTFPKSNIPFIITLLNIDGNPRSEFVFDR